MVEVKEKRVDQKLYTYFSDGNKVDMQERNV